MAGVTGQDASRVHKEKEAAGVGERGRAGGMIPQGAPHASRKGRTWESQRSRCSIPGTKELPVRCHINKVVCSVLVQ